MEYLAPNQIKPFLLHEDTIVRQTVASYFRESFGQETELIPLVVKACKKYGEKGNFASLEASRRFPQSYLTVSSVLGLLERTEHEASVHLLNDILAAMNAPVFFLCQAKLRDARHVFPFTLNVLHQRLGIWNRPPRRLVAAFERFVEEVRDELCPDCINQTYGGDLVDALVHHFEPSSKILIDRLAYCSSRRDCGALFVIDLLGKRRIRRSIPAIIECFNLDSDHFAERATEALIRIGEVEAIQILRARMPQEDENFRYHAAMALAGFKHPESEKLLLELLETEENSRLRTRYCEGLCSHFSIKGEPFIRRQIEPAGSVDGTCLKAGLLVSSIIRGRHLPEAAAWREEVLNPNWEPKDFELEPVFEEMSSFPDAPAPFPWRERKVGRNDPCSCGSGKKYKRCCGW
jgi:hypothetical protein